MELAPLLQPHSIALVDEGEAAWTRTMLDNFERSGYRGKVYLVNRDQDTAHARRCFRRLNDIPGPLDLALVSGRAGRHAGELLDDCINKGVRSVCVYRPERATEASGAPAAHVLARRAREAGLLLAGPDTFGFIQLSRGVGAWSRPLPEGLRPGPVALVFQSNLLLDAALRPLAHCGAGVHAAVATGEGAVIRGADYIDYLLDQDDVGVVGAVLDTPRRPRRFLEISDHALRVGKPLVVLSARGATPENGDAAEMVGAASVSSALFRQKGVVEVSTLEELLQTCCFLGYHPAPAGRKVLFMAPSRIACRVLDHVGAVVGLKTPQPQDAGIERSSGLQNPLYVPADPDDADAEGFRGLVASVADGDYDALVYAFTSNDGQDTRHRLQALQQEATRAGKVGVGLNMLGGGGNVSDEIALLMREHLPLQGTSLGLRVLASAARWGSFLRAHLEFDEASEPHVVFPFDARRRALDLLEGLPDGPLNEAVSRELLAMYGVPLVPARPAESPDQAVDAAEELGYPVAMKALATGIASMSETGAIALELPDATAVRIAFDQVTAAARRAGGANVAGAIVSRMVRGSEEVACGALRHPRWGPTVVIGVGGRAGRLLSDRTVRVCPASRRDLRQMLSETAIHKMLDGFGGRPPADKTALVDLLERLSLLMQDLHAQIASIEMNPVAVFPAGGGCVALDALVTKRNGGSARSTT